MTESFANQPWLTFITFAPLVGALFIMLRRMLTGTGEDGTVAPEEQAQVDKVARWVALIFTSATFVLSLGVYALYDPSIAGYQLVEEVPWLGGGINYKMGVDGISILFVLLTTFFMPICIMASWNSVKSRIADYMIAFLVLETLMIGVFCALDLFVFYFFFEGSLIPMFLIIGVWGSKGTKEFAGYSIPSRIYASLKFFLYTLLGSLLLLIAMAWMYAQAGTTDIPTLQQVDFPAGAQKWLWIAFFASFAVKMPMWPVHTWLPDAHVQAPTAGSVVLAAILLKMGGYGFLRFSLPMFPLASADFAPFVFALSVIAIIYTSLVALAQEDMKKLIAYSSVAHMGFVTMGIFTGTEQGIEGGLFQMLSHGFISGALFLCVGVVYDRMHTREIAAYGGLVHRMPLYAFLFLFFTLGNVGLPGTSGFVGEILTMTGAFKFNSWIAFFAAFGVIFSAAYALRLYRAVIYGKLEKDALKAIPDVDTRELVTLGVLMAFALYLGFNPGPALNVFSPAVDLLIENYDAALAAGGAS
ncbi:NADH-quinone oxidoreductase subunit M [Hyphococcus luteus]|uniref:NADH-quinone oxidoreductase subunit M n=1 Tax=Hyphococcus luteus TaxID=2058213 RepID=A0A2S7KAF5_9PROT|nr:NADH-quinone oxidoreductase subunit M [Marinicaulis flavus]PQA89463.1 NADH-quinone oxidoreductase subunit M [Marinicaulis flavus]